MLCVRKPIDATLLEREREVGELEQAVGEVLAGDRGGLLVVEGHAGLGKTRLLQAARTLAADAGLQVMTARATEFERDFPGSLVRQLFEHALAARSPSERAALLADAGGAARGALGMADDAAPPGAGDPFTILHGLYRLTAALAQERPLLLSLDDVHWSDAASLDYLGFLLPRLDELPVLVTVALRPGVADAPPSLQRIAADAVARRLAPRALSREATATLLTATFGAEPAQELSDACHEASGGNPFLLCELARTLAQEAIGPDAAHAGLVRELTPDRVTRSVVLRLRRLSPDAQAVAGALVVLGDGREPRLIGALAGLDADRVRIGADELRRAAILDPDAELRFVHPLVRNAVHSDLGAGRRAAEHARAAALLRAQGAGAEHLAPHLVGSEPSGDPEAVRTLVEAGTRALSNGAPGAAVTYLMRALREPPPPELRAAVLAPLIDASTRVADRGVCDAIEADVFDELARTPSLRVEWARPLTVWLGISGRFEQAMELLQGAIDDATQAGDAERAFRLEMLLGILAQRTPETARACLTPYFARFDADSTGGRLAAALKAEWAMLDGTAAEAVAHARRAIDDGRTVVELPELSFPAWHVAALIAADELDEAARAGERVMAVAREHGATVQLVGASTIQAHVALHRGELAVAEDHVRRAVDAARLGGMVAFVPVLCGLLVEVLIERGELDAAEAELGAPDVVPSFTAHGSWFSLPLLLRGRLRLEQSRPREAAEDLMRMREQTQRWGLAGSPLLPTAGYAARAFAALGEPERARALADEGLAHARRWGSPSVVSRGLRAQAHAVAGSGEQQLALLREAHARLEGSPARLERAHAAHELGAALRRANHRVEAREPLREALELARRCGAAALAGRAHDELQACGETRRHRTAFGITSLTPSERRVAELAASGLTNRQVAQTLFLTVKTIETHLSASYDKLGIRSRRQLAGTLADGPHPGAAAAGESVRSRSI